jgi:hypothetical protein
MALMAEIAGALGDDGVPIPEDREQRRQLALAFLKDDADECLRQASPPKNARLTPPKRISGDGLSGVPTCGGTFEARGSGGLEGVKFHFVWGPGWYPFDYTGFAIDNSR